MAFCYEQTCSRDPKLSLTNRVGQRHSSISVRSESKSLWSTWDGARSAPRVCEIMEETAVWKVFLLTYYGEWQSKYKGVN